MSEKLQDGSSIVYGTVIQKTPQKGYNQETQSRTDEVVATNYIILAEDGFHTVKVPTDKSVDVPVNAKVAWRVITAYWKQNNGASGQSTRFVSVVLPQDLQAINAILNQKGE